MRIPRLEPKKSALVSGDYGTGKTTLVKAWVRSLGRGIFWAAPQQTGAPAEYSDIAVVVHNFRDLDRAARKSSYVVWPSPPSSSGLGAIREAYNEFCAYALTLRRTAIVSDEFQRITQDCKRLSDLPPACQDLAELGHKEPSNLAKIWVAHRLAQIPLVFGAGAYRVSTRPFPGDEDALTPFFGKTGVERMKRFRVGDFAFWSAETGAQLPLRLQGGTRPYSTEVTAPQYKERIKE
jgi:hypothetical protein